MGRLLVPHEDLNPHFIETPTPEHFPKQARLTWIDFHPESRRTKPPSCQPDNASLPQWRCIVDEIENTRARFVMGNPKGFHTRCSNIDRSAVIAVYNEALIELEHKDNIDANKIHLEVKTKVSTILDLREAASDDAVFYAKGAFLSPLEPQYAQPRLDYYDRGSGVGDDSFYWTGFKRLREWRKAGWPKAYPKTAVEREMRERKRRRNRGTGMITIRREEMLTELKLDTLDWGEEVDADPGRPWR